MRRTVLVAGASGLVGYAVMKHYAAQPDTEVIAVSRRRPHDTFGARYVAADLTDEAACNALFGSMTGVTHLVYAALYEELGLIAGWLADDTAALGFSASEACGRRDFYGPLPVGSLRAAEFERL